MLKSLIHLTLIFVQGERKSPSLILLYVSIQAPQRHL